MSQDPVRFALLEGKKLDAASAELLEAHVQAHPTDHEARLKLLGYLFMRRLDSSELARRRAAHVVWFIENEPRHEVLGSPLATVDGPEDPGFTAAAAAWGRHTAKPDPDPYAILHAARFFSLASPEESKTLLERGERLRPHWSIWASELGTLAFRSVTGALRRDDEPDDGEREQAKVALAHFERALRLCKTDDERFPYVVRAAEAAVECEENEKARALAQETLRLEPEQTAHRHRLDYAHTAHIVLGRVALAEGDVARAIDELIAAGKLGSVGGPVLRSFGPDFSLASRLHARGETQAVLAYLDECARFWNPERIAFWRAQIERGEKPRLFRGYDPDLPS